MVALKNTTDSPASARLLRGVLVPREYTKLDSLLDIVAFVAEDIAEEESAAAPTDEQDSRAGAYVSKLNREALRAKARNFFLKKLHQDTKDISRTLLESQDGKTGVYYAPSQAYSESKYTKYWFALHDHQIEFLTRHAEGYVACLCVGSGMLFAPWSEFAPHVKHMLESSKDKRHWRHIVLRMSKEGTMKLWLRSDAQQPPVDFTKWFTSV
jgi:predicted RNA-binding protein YlxR (DUF448 family)